MDGDHGMLVYHKLLLFPITCTIKISDAHLHVYSLVQRGTVIEKCLAQQHTKNNCDQGSQPTVSLLGN